MVNTLSGRISTVSNHRSIMQGVEEAGNAAGQATARIASGKLDGGYSAPEMAESTRTILKTEQNLMQGEATKFTTNRITGRINDTYTINERLKEIATKVRAQVAYVRDATKGTANADFSTFCQNNLTEVESLLNRKDPEGRGLFGGAATKTNAVDFSLLATPTPGATPDATYTAYFKGGPGNHTSTIDGEPVEYGANATDPGMRDLIFWLKQGTATTPDHVEGSSSSQRLEGMMDGLATTMGGLTDTQKKVGEQLNKIEGIQERNVKKMTDNTDTMSQLTDADPALEFIRAAQEMLRQSMTQNLLVKETDSLRDMLRNI